MHIKTAVKEKLIAETRLRLSVSFCFGLAAGTQFCFGWAFFFFFGLDTLTAAVVQHSSVVETRLSGSFSLCFRFQILLLARFLLATSFFRFQFLQPLALSFLLFLLCLAFRCLRLNCQISSWMKKTCMPLVKF